MCRPCVVVFTPGHGVVVQRCLPTLQIQHSLALVVLWMHLQPQLLRTLCGAWSYLMSSVCLLCVCLVFVLWLCFVVFLVCVFGFFVFLLNCCLGFPSRRAHRFFPSLDPPYLFLASRVGVPQLSMLLHLKFQVFCFLFVLID